jgi:hypothetical protein
MRNRNASAKPAGSVCNVSYLAQPSFRQSVFCQLRLKYRSAAINGESGIAEKEAAKIIIAAAAAAGNNEAQKLAAAKRNIAAVAEPRIRPAVAAWPEIRMKVIIWRERRKSALVLAASAIRRDEIQSEISA